MTNEKKEGTPPNPIIVDRGITMLDKSAAFLAGAAISNIVSNLKQASSAFFLKALEKTPVLPSFDETNRAVNKMLDKKCLKDAGVKVLFVEDTTEDMKKIADIISKNSLVGFKKFFNIGEKNIISKGIRKYADLNAPLVAKGKKTSYLVNEKIAIVSKNIHQMIFHEIGHAKVAENKVLRPLLTVGKKLPWVGTVAGFCALEHTPRLNDSNNTKTLWEKTQDYMDKNIGKIAFLTFVPWIIEKEIASGKSLKYAKKYLDKPKIQALKKLYGINSLAYLATAFATAAGIGLGNKVQNNIIKQKNSPQDVYNLLI